MVVTPRKRHPESDYGNLGSTYQIIGGGAVDFTKILNSKGNTFDPTFANIQVAIDDLGLLGNESGAAIPDFPTWYAPKTLRGWVKLPGSLTLLGTGMITLKPYVHLDMSGCRIIVTGDYHGVSMKIGSKISNGTITATTGIGGPAAYNKSLIYLNGDPYHKIGTQTAIEDMHLIGNITDPGAAVPFKGEGIQLYCGDATKYSIYNVYVNRVAIERCIYGIHINNASDTFTPSINGNFFQHVWLQGCQYGIYMESAHAKPTEGNIFDNCTNEPTWVWWATYGTSLEGVRLTGNWNVLTNFSLWDWVSVVSHGGPDTGVVLDANSSQCYVSLRGAKATTYNYLHNDGDSNMILNCSRGQIEVENADKYGATASVGDGDTITHNLGHTPQGVIATGSVAGEIVAVTAIAGATFTVAIKKHDGSAGTDQTIYWRCMRAI
jgi:hypothetical protein